MRIPGSSILGQCESGSSSRSESSSESESRDLMTKNCKILVRKKILFFIRTLFLSLHGGRPYYSIQAKPLALQNNIFLHFVICCGSFCPPGSEFGSRWPKSMWIQYPCLFGSGSTTLVYRYNIRSITVKAIHKSTHLYFIYVKLYNIILYTCAVVDIRLLKMKKVIKQSTVHSSGRSFSLQMYIVRTYYCI